MEDFSNLLAAVKRFKVKSVDILGIEQSIYRVEEFHGLFEIAIITANIDEFVAVKSIVDGIKKTTFNKNDSTIYHTGEIKLSHHTWKIIIPFPYTMGIEASSALTTKVVSTFRPKYLFMVGSCAGNKKVARLAREHYRMV